MGACGALLMPPEEMNAWAAEIRAGTSGPFQMNLWIPDPPPLRDAAHESSVCEFLAQWGPAVEPETSEAVLPNFAAQCATLLEIRPRAVSSIMGIFPPQFVKQLKAAGVSWFATVSSVAEAKAAEEAGADVLIAQGMEAGGHRGAFDQAKAEQQQVGLLALVPAVVDAVRLPVVAAGGIADGRGVAAALILGASAAVIGTGFLRSSESNIHAAWAAALAQTAPEETMLSRAFSGRAGRTIATDYARAASGTNVPAPAPYPVQRGLTAGMQKQAAQSGDLHRMQAWAGQSARLARAEPAAEIVQRVWAEARSLLR